MFRTFGVTDLGPRRENRIIFYSILFLVIATGIYILTFYLGGEKEGGKEQKDNSSVSKEIPETSKRASALMAGTKRSINFSQDVELPKSF